MDLADIKLTDFLQLIISSGGFIVVVYQILQLKQTMQGDTHAKLYEHYLKVNELFLHKTHLRPYFYERKSLEKETNDPQDATLKAEVEMMCEVIAGLLEHAAVQKNNLPGDSWKNCWEAYTCERFSQSPELQKFFERNRQWYARLFCDVVDRCQEQSKKIMK
jgi:hypothetical protein